MFVLCLILIAVFAYYTHPAYYPAPATHLTSFASIRNNYFYRLSSTTGVSWERTGRGNVEASGRSLSSFANWNQFLVRPRPAATPTWASSSTSCSLWESPGDLSMIYASARGNRYERVRCPNWPRLDADAGNRANSPATPSQHAPLAAACSDWRQLALTCGASAAWQVGHGSCGP